VCVVLMQLSVGMVENGVCVCVCVCVCVDLNALVCLKDTCKMSRDSRCVCCVVIVRVRVMVRVMVSVPD